MDASGELSVILDLNESIFSENLKSQVASHFLNVIDAFINDFNQPIQKQSLLTINEKQDFFKSETQTSIPYKSILKAFKDHSLERVEAVSQRNRNLHLSRSFSGERISETKDKEAQRVQDNQRMKELKKRAAK